MSEPVADGPAVEVDDGHVIYNRHRPDEVHALAGFVDPQRRRAGHRGRLERGRQEQPRPRHRRDRPPNRRTASGSVAGTSHAGPTIAAPVVTRVFDDPRIGTAPELSIEDNLAMAMSRGRRRTMRFALNAKRRRIMWERLAALGLGLETRLHDPVGLLSAGQRQSLTLVLAALGAPAVLLLDEHLAALDPATARRVLDLTSDVVAEAAAPR